MNGRPFQHSAIFIFQVHDGGDILRILAEQRSIVVFGREVLRDVLMIGVIDIKRFDVMAQPSAHLCLDVGIAVMDDHRVEVFVVDVDGSFVCGVDEQKINIRRNVLGFEDGAADGELFFAHFEVGVMKPPQAADFALSIVSQLGEF